MASFCVFCSALLSPSNLRLIQPVCLRKGPSHRRFTAKEYVGQRLERGVGAKELPFLAKAPLFAWFARVGDVHSTIRDTLSRKACVAGPPSSNSAGSSTMSGYILKKSLNGLPVN